MTLFLLAALFLVAAAIADGITTRLVIKAGGWETNPLFGKYPSALRTFGEGALIIGGEISLSYFVWRKYTMWILVAQAILHTYLAVHNYRISRD